MKKILSTLCIAFLLTGCFLHRYMDESFPQKKLDKIVVGESLYMDVKYLFGNPEKETKTETGKTYVYTGHYYVSDNVQTVSKPATLTVNFDQNGYVTNYQYQEN